MQTLKKMYLQPNIRILLLDVEAYCINKLRAYGHTSSIATLNHN